MKLRLSRSARVVTALTAVTVVAGAVLVAGPGYRAAQVVMHSGAAWLASARTGEIVRVDGATAEVTARVRVASPGSALSVTQDGSNAIVLNQATGELRRVEGATEEVSPPVVVLPASDDLAVLPTRHAFYEVNVHSGMVASVATGTLKEHDKPKPLVDRMSPGGPVVDSRGKLWALDDQTGDLAWLTGSNRRARPAATKPGTSRLAVTKDQPALVDTERGTAELLDPGSGRVTRSARPELQAGESLLVSGSAERARLHLASSTRGTLVTCAFDSGSCTAPLTVGSPGSDLGTPVEIRDHAVVPDYSTGHATIVDLATSRVIAQRQLLDHPGRFELLARDGILFFNDPNSNRAGVLDLAGDVRTITKYTEGDEKPDSDEHRQAGQAINVDNKTQKPGQGKTPVRTVPPSRTNPVPTPGPRPSTSIVVKPGNYGVVGDEFELTLVRPPSTGTNPVHWQFGDGAEATGTTVSHRWRQPGTFTVRATSGPDTSAETTVIVDPVGTPPRIIGLSMWRPRPVIGESVHFSAQATRNPDRWAWRVTRPNQFAPDATATTPEFTHSFDTPGVYTVTLTITWGSQSATATEQLTVGRGTVKAWGVNNAGQTNVPESLQSGVIAVSSGFVHSLALKSDGTVIPWGSSAGGNLKVPAEASSGVIAVAAGGLHSMALRKDGRVIVWGGDDDRLLQVPKEAQSDVVAIAAGFRQALALKEDGSVIAWGGVSGREPEVPDDARRNVVAIASGTAFKLALKANGTVVGWGNVEGPLPIPDEAKSGVVAISAGAGFVLALKEDGTTIGWGHESSPAIPVPGAAKGDVTAVVAGESHAFVIKRDGTAIVWGEPTGGAVDMPAEYNKGILAGSAGQWFGVVLLEAL